MLGKEYFIDKEVIYIEKFFKVRRYKILLFLVYSFLVLLLLYVILVNFIFFGE